MNEMKNKRLFSFMIVLAILFSFGSTASAADTAIPEPTINRINSGDTAISGTGHPGSSLIVTFPDGTDSGAITVDSGGAWTVTAPAPLAVGAGIAVEQTVTFVLTYSAAFDPSQSSYAVGDVAYLSIGFENLAYDLTAGDHTLIRVILWPFEMKFLTGGTVTIGGNPADSSQYQIGHLSVNEVYYEETIAEFNITDLNLDKNKKTSDDYIRLPVAFVAATSGLFYSIMTTSENISTAAATVAEAAVAGSITYDANGADSGTVPADLNPYYEGDTVTVMGNPGGLQKNDYVFAGWTPDADGAGTVYWENDTFTADGSDIILYAKWAPTEYIVTANSNGGSAVADQTVENGGTATEPVDPTKEGYIFDGWYTDNGTFTDAWDFNTAVTEDIALHAKWTAVSESTSPAVSTSPTSTTESSATTGDYNNILLWLLIFLFSLGTIVTVLYFIFRNKAKK